jgi:SM-20-related protein
MILLDYNALRDTPVASEPFPHVVVPHFVPPDALRAVVADLPPLDKRGSFPVTGVALGPAARSLMTALRS